jgi:hypothetical protein
MKTSCLCILAAGVILGTAARAEEAPIIAKARAYLGSEAALDGVHSLHWVGHMVVETAGDPTKGGAADIDIIFQKPWQECVTVVSADALTQTALDDRDGWHREQKHTKGDPAVFDPHRSMSLTILGPEQIKSLRTDTWESLYFLRGLDDAGGRTEDLGPATVDGIACEKLALIHEPEIVYYRYFDLATGRLVFSETLKAAKIREHGEIVSGGIRFPKSIVVLETVDGKDRTTTLTIDSVTVNETFPASLFAVPLPPLPLTEFNPGGPNQPAPAPAGDVPAPPSPP